MNELAQRIRAARWMAKLSLSALAQDVGVQGHSVWRWEKGRSCPGVADVVRVAAACHVSLVWLLTGAGPMHAAEPISSTDPSPR